MGDTVSPLELYVGVHDDIIEQLPAYGIVSQSEKTLDVEIFTS